MVILLVGSCKKEFLTNQSPNTELLQKAKVFYNQQTTSLPKISSANQSGPGVNTEKHRFEEKMAPIWNEAKMEKTLDGRTVMTVPLTKYILDNKDISYVRKYVFEERNGDIYDGKIIEVIGATELIDEKGEATITSYKDKHIEGFSGAVISYDLTYRYLEGHHYKNSRQVPSNVHITAKLPATRAKSSGQGKLASANIPNKISTEIGDDGPTQTCTNWYLVTSYYDQYGDFMYSTETYLSTTCTSGGYVGPPPLGGGSTETVVFDCAGVPNGTAQNTPCGCITGAARGTQCPPKDIRNKTTDTCISKTVEEILAANKDIEGKLSEIIKSFDASKNVRINIFDGITDDNAPGQIKFPAFDGNIFKANITLQTSYISGQNAASKESIISTIIHELLHAYIKTSNPDLLKNHHHNEIATNYAVPMTQYLVQYFGMTERDAFSLAWSGIPDSEVFGNASSDTFFTYKVNDVNKFSVKKI